MTTTNEFAAPPQCPVEGQNFGVGARLLRYLTKGLQYGQLKIILPSGTAIEVVGPQPGPHATITIRRWSMLRRVLAAGDIGFAEGYLQADWTTPDLTAVIRLAAQNSKALAPAINGNLMMRMVNRVGHLLKANTRHGSRRNIEAHYDLGNDFYETWLDASMLYSSAIFDSKTQTLEAAQRLKLDRIRERLELRGGETVLEIGCGWGALAVHLAETSDARVTGITLSPSQLSWAKRVSEASTKAAQIDLRLQDYRDIEGGFDRIVSIEMFEAVGEAYWSSYFATLKRALNPGGIAVLQIISIAEDRYETYRTGTDFIQKYVFPGGFLPSNTALNKVVTQEGLEISKVAHFGQSYAETLREWRARFHGQWSVISTLGFDDHFRRLWHYYLCYCEAGFEERSIDVGLYTIRHR